MENRSQRHGDRRFYDAMHLIRPLLVALLAMFFATGTGRAQGFPDRTVRLVVPSAPGGSNDILARAVAQKLTEAWKQAVVVDNRPGGGGITGTEIAAKSVADGYTLLLANISLVVNPSVHLKLPYKVPEDFSAVTSIGDTSNVLVVNPSVKATTLGDLIALAKSSPGTLNYASAGNASSPHLAAELFKLRAGLDIVHIPYQGTGPALAALLGGEVALTFATVPPIVPLVSTGRLRALAITSTRRSSALPKVPTFGEAGVANYEFSAWFGIVAPAGTPTSIVSKISTDVRTIVGGSEFRAKYTALGIDLVGSTPEEFSTQVRQELRKWHQVVGAAGIQVN